MARYDISITQRPIGRQPVHDTSPRARESRTLAQMMDGTTMNNTTRDELNAKLETIEVKMDARIALISSSIDGFLALQAERDTRLDDTISNVRRDIVRLGSLKLNIWGAMLTAIALGVAVAALSTTFYQTGISDKTTLTPSPLASSGPALND